jgi:hypothetical protein
LQTNKGVKRKADTTTPSGLSASYDQPYETPLAKGTTDTGALQKRENASRSVKRSKKEEEEDEVSPAQPAHQVAPPRASAAGVKDPLAEQLKFCQGIIRELFTKKHSVSI